MVYRLPNSIHVARDGWDWLFYGFSIFAALGAALAFWTWFTQLRRTPEVRFLWSWGQSDWSPTDSTKVLNAFGSKSIRVHLVNVGTGTAAKLSINVIVPDWLQLEVNRDHDPSAVRPTDDPSVGSKRGIYQVIAKENFIPGGAVLVEFTITVPAKRDCPPESGFVVISVASDGFTRTGHRLWPSLATRIPAPGDDFWADWSIKKYKRKIRRVRAMPNEVKAGPGQRSDRRAVEIDMQAKVTFNNERVHEAGGNNSA
jgi:hypothetical protein